MTLRCAGYIASDHTKITLQILSSETALKQQSQSLFQEAQAFNLVGFVTSKTQKQTANKSKSGEMMTIQLKDQKKPNHLCSIWLHI